MSNPLLLKCLPLLKSPDPAVRVDAIKRIELIGATDALAALAEVFATDPEPVIRELAQEVGKQIYYGAIRQSLEKNDATEAERMQAAEILERARQKRDRPRKK